MNQKQLVTGLWIGEILPPLAILCIKSYQRHGFNFRLLKYGGISNIPNDVEVVDAREFVEESEIFIHNSGSLAPAADRIQFEYLFANGGFWTDMDMVCLKFFRIVDDPWFALQEPGLAALGAFAFPPKHEIMRLMALRMRDPAYPMPWDDEETLSKKLRWIKEISSVKDRRISAEYTLGGPEGFTAALSHFNLLEQADSPALFYPVHYTAWRWNFDGTYSMDDKIYSESLGIHLWGELLRREPDAMENISPYGTVGQLMRLNDCWTKGSIKMFPPSIDHNRTKVLVGVCSCRANRLRRDSIRETWLKDQAEDVAVIFFVGGGTELDGEPDTVVLDVNDSYPYLPAKVIHFFKYALEVSDFEWIFKCDDDTYLSVSRLPELIDVDYDLIGDVSLEQRGSPSGGAGYFISRKMVEKIVSDGTIPPVGPEDVIIGEAAVRHGARWLSTSRLRLDALEYPTKENAQVTAHWCSIDRIRAIDLIYHEIPTQIFDAFHPHWKDQIMVYDGKYFMRRNTGCYGKWTEIENGVFELAWFDWKHELFRLDIEDTSRINKLEAVDSKQIY